MEFLYTLLSAFGGYFYWKLTTTPGSKINRRVPKVKIKNVQILPSLKITVKGRIIHLHHWVWLTILLCVSFIGPWWLDTWAARGFMVGGALQGLRFPDRGILKKEIKDMTS